MTMSIAHHSNMPVTSQLIYIIWQIKPKQSLFYRISLFLKCVWLITYSGCIFLLQKKNVNISSFQTWDYFFRRLIVFFIGYSYFSNGMSGDGIFVWSHIFLKYVHNLIFTAEANPLSRFSFYSWIWRLPLIIERKNWTKIFKGRKGCNKMWRLYDC